MTNVDETGYINYMTCSENEQWMAGTDISND